MFKRFLAFSAVAFVLIAFTFQLSPLRSNTNRFFLSLMHPLFSLTSQVSSQTVKFRNHFYNYWNAIDKQSEQEQQIHELESRLVQYEETQNENSRLRRLLDFRSELPQKAVGVSIMGYALKPWKKSILLNKGSKQHIRPFSPLVVPAGLVGRVIDVGLYSSQAILLTDPESRVTAVTLESRAQGVIEGNGGEKLKLRYLNLDDAVQVGEIVVTSGLGDLYPKGLRIGRVDSVERDADGLHLAATVSPSVRFSKIEEMLCLEPCDLK